MVYSPYPPYELRRNGLLDFFTMQRLRRFARYWDLVANSGVFAETSALICAGPSPFNQFLAFSDWLYIRTGQTHAIARGRLMELINIYIIEVLKRPAAAAAALAARDALRARSTSRAAPMRQSRRLG